MERPKPVVGTDPEQIEKARRALAADLERAAYGELEVLFGQPVPEGWASAWRAALERIIEIDADARRLLRYAHRSPEKARSWLREQRLAGTGWVEHLLNRGGLPPSVLDLVRAVEEGRPPRDNDDEEAARYVSVPAYDYQGPSLGREPPTKDLRTAVLRQFEVLRPVDRGGTLTDGWDEVRLLTDRELAAVSCVIVRPQPTHADLRNGVTAAQLLDRERRNIAKTRSRVGAVRSPEGKEAARQASAARAAAVLPVSRSHHHRGSIGR